MEKDKKYKLEDLDDLKILKDLDREKYINNFINNFMRVFPNILTEEEIRKRINKYVERIILVKFNEPGKLGRYVSHKKTICVELLEENIVFHEFIHALSDSSGIYETLLNKAEIEGLEKGLFHHHVIRGVEESLTTIAENLFTINKRDNKAIYRNGMFYFEKNKSSILLNSYDTGAYLMQELEVLNRFVSDESILTSFLKGEKYMNKIYKIFYTYLRLLYRLDGKKDFDNIEMDAMRLANEFVQNLSIVVNPNFEIEEEKEYDVRSTVEYIEKQMCQMLDLFAYYFVNNDKAHKASKNLVNNMKELLITTTYEGRTRGVNAEQKLLALIFGGEIPNEEKTKYNHSLKKVEQGIQRYMM